jgi:hypothetical protein
LPGTLLCVTIGITAPFWDAQLSSLPDQPAALARHQHQRALVLDPSGRLVAVLGVDVPRLGVASFACSARRSWARTAGFSC